MMFKQQNNFKAQQSLDKMDLKHKSKKLVLILSQLSRDELKDLTIRLVKDGICPNPLLYQVEISVEMQKILLEIIYKNSIDKQAISDRKPDKMLLNLKLIWLKSRLEEEIREILESKPMLVGNSILHYLK